ncbi:hypothetical protein ACFE04_016288 [Oxalis oulophora]
MEGGSGVTIIGAEAPSAYHMAPRNENPSQNVNSSGVDLSVVSVGGGLSGKKKRGRPRKYGPDGKPTLSPTPISSLVPPGSAGDFSSGKRARGWSGSSEKKLKKLGMVNLGDLGAGSIGSNFTPHVINVNTGEDVTMKVISFSQQGPRAICILSANGIISNVTLRQPDSSGGTLTYEVVVGSFLPAGHQEQKPKKPKTDPIPSIVTSVPNQLALPPPSNSEREDDFGRHMHENSNAQNQNLAPPQHFRRDAWPTMHTMQQEPRNGGTDINISLPAG